MRRSAIFVAGLLLLSTLAGAGLAAQHGDQGNQTDTNDSTEDGGGQNATTQDTNETDDGNETRDGNQTRGEDRGGDRGPPASAQERREQARERAQKAGLFGLLSYENGVADGQYISFELDESTATVTGYTLHHNGTNTSVFAEVAPADFTEDRPARAAGSQLHLAGEETRLQAHDNPTGLLRYTAQNATTVTFELADGASTGDVRNGSLVQVTADDRKGTVILAGNGTLTASNGTISAELSDAGTVLFKATPLGGSPAEVKQSRALDRATAEGKLGASVRMAGVNGTPAADQTELGVNVSPREASDGRARIEVSADTPEGKVVNLAIDKDTINVSEPSDASVKFDGEPVDVNATIDEVVNATGDEPVANVLVTNSTVEITVFVPDFSVHSLTTKESTDVADLPTPPSTDNPTGAASSLAQQARQQAVNQAQQWSDLPQQARDNAAQQAQDARLFGAFEVSGSAASGDFVSANVDASAGSISDVEVSADGSTTVLQSVSFSEYTKATDLQQAGPTLALVGQDVTATVHDQPTSPIQVKAGSSSVTVTYQLPSDASLERVDDQHAKITVEGEHAHLLVASGNGELSLQGDQIQLALGANAQSLFVVHPDEASAAADRMHERLGAIKQGAYGAQVAVASASDQAVETVQSISVTAQTTATETGESVTTEVSSQVPDPRVVEIDVPKDAVGASATGDVEVQIDGQTVDTVDSAQQLYAEAGSSTAQAHVSEDGGALQVLVNVAGFSSHDVTIQSTDDGGSGGGSGGTNDTGGGGSGGTDDTQSTPGVGAIGLTAALATGAALARREN